MRCRSRDDGDRGVEGLVGTDGVDGDGDRADAADGVAQAVEQTVAVGDRDRAEVAQVVVVARRRSGDHGRAAQHRQLDDHATDPARSAVHQHHVAVMRARGGQGVHGGRTDEQEARRGGPLEVRRSADGHLLRGDDPAGVTAADPPRDHLVTGGEPADRGPDGAHHARHLVPEPHRQAGGVGGPAARVPLPVDRVDGGRPDVDHDVARSRLRGVDLDHPEYLGSAVGDRDDGSAAECHGHRLHPRGVDGKGGALCGRYEPKSLARYGLLNTPSGSACRRTRWASANRGYSSPRRAASSQCILPQCGRPPTSATIRSTARK